MVFNLLTTLGLRENHRLLDVGCGSLRCARLLIPYLNAGNYVGVEPNRWLIEDGIANETGADQIRLKEPQFFFNDDFHFDETFGEFDFALAQSIFSHASLEQIDRCLLSVSQRLKENGALVATFMLGEQDYEGSAWTYPGCVYYREATIEQLARKHGLSYTRLDWLHPHGQIWFLMARSGFDQSLLESGPLTWNTLIRARRF
jgi:cyclopropane fatty-acyl-phospholipid synthase-like methyltransferase